MARALEAIAIPLVIRKQDGYHIRTIESDGAEKRVRWVGPFEDARAIARWLALLYTEQCAAMELTEGMHPTAIGLPAELAVLRPLDEQVETLRRAGLLDGEGQVSVVE